MTFDPRKYHATAHLVWIDLACSATVSLELCIVCGLYTEINDREITMYARADNEGSVDFRATMDFGFDIQTEIARAKKAREAKNVQDDELKLAGYEWTYGMQRHFTTNLVSEKWKMVNSSGRDQARFEAALHFVESKENQ